MVRGNHRNFLPAVTSITRGDGFVLYDDAISNLVTA